MDLSKCNCDKAGFCPVFCRDMDEKNYHWCKDATESKRINYYQENIGPITNKRKFGIIIPNFNKVGGVETWLENLMKMFPKEISQICTISSNNNQRLYSYGIPITSGVKQAREMCATFKNVLVWGEQNIERLLEKGNPKNLFFIHHGDETSIWGRETFDIQSKYSNNLIAVNKNVAKKYNCTLIENFVDISRCSESHNPKGKTVTWAHRLSSEKRPEILIEIAKNMPDYNFILCGEGNLKQTIVSSMPKNCKYLGSPTNLKDIFEKTSVFISTSDQEAFGYSVGEAILSGVPVVSFAVGLGKDFADVVIKDKFTISDWISAIKKCSGERSKNSQKLLDNYNEKIFYDKWSKIINTP